MKKLAFITFEIEETETIRSSGGRVSYCEACAQDVWMTTPAVIALKSGITERTTFRLIESRVLDCDETGRLLVCPRCVARAVTNTNILDETSGGPAALGSWENNDENLNT
jgi:hypothetical protein